MIIMIVLIIIEELRNEVGYPQTKCGELSKKLKNGLKTIHCKLPKFQKIEFSIAHETHFRGAKSTFEQQG